MPAVVVEAEMVALTVAEADPLADTDAVAEPVFVLDPLALALGSADGVGGSDGGV